MPERHGLPFYVAGPLTTIDRATPTGADIVIEERPPDEIRTIAGRPTAPAAADVWNPAFDVTPADLITGIVTEVGVLEPSYEASIARALGERQADPS